MKTLSLAALCAAVALAGCASRQPGSAPAPAGSPAPAAAAAPAAPANPSDMRIVKSADGRFDGEMVGTPAPGSHFARLRIGMSYEQVTSMIGAPSRMTLHETGKRWIPFYYGNDVVRMETLFPGEGCLSFTGGNQFGAGGRELIRITADPGGKRCTF
jgi:hypothetical protein